MFRLKHGVESVLSAFLFKGCQCALPCIALVIFGLLSPSIFAATLMVTNNEDSGEGSLRQAITNAVTGDTINFDDDYTINLESKLPNIVTDLTIDATGHQVTLDGSNSSARMLKIDSGEVTLRNLTFTSSNSTFAGTVLRADNVGTTVKIYNSTFKNNTSASQGGAIRNAQGATMTIENSLFEGNTANYSEETGTCGGGAIGNSASNLTVKNSTFVNNTAAKGGGAICTWDADSTVSLQNLTFSGNEAQGTEGGDDVNIAYSSTEMTNSILASINNSACVVTGDSLTGQNNLVEDESCTSLTGFFAANPGLNTLVDNGGLTQTISLQTNSDALNEGEACPSFDQRGVPRPSNGCDLGAFEVSTCTTQGQISQEECAALEQFFISTDGENWSDNTGWLTTDTPCSWVGITCLVGDGFQTVTAINLNDKNLTGEIPDLSDLTQLQSLDLGSNNLTGDIQGIESLAELFELKLDNNQLSSMGTSFPSNIQLLYLHSNKLTEAFPFNLPTSLTELTLHKNALTGEILDLSAFSSLVTADFSYNMLSSAESQSSLDALEIGDWLNTQTIPVSDVSATVISETEVQIAWNPIAYTNDDGYYTIRYGTSSGSYSNSINTSNKEVSSQNITGLTEGETYYFVVETYTGTHEGQSNTLTSEYSTEVSATPEAVACSDQIVTNGNDDGQGSLRQAIDDVCEDGVITFDGSMTVNLISEIPITKDLTIDGESNNIVIDGDSATRLFNLPNGNKNVILKNLTFTGAQAGTQNGGVLLVSGNVTLTIDKCVFNNAKAADGGAIYVTGGQNNLTITHSIFNNNKATNGGGAIHILNDGTTSISNSTFLDNTLTDNSKDGGAISVTNGGNLNVTNATFYNNGANRGSGIHADGAQNVSINNVTFSQNSSINVTASGTNAYGTSVYSRNTSLTMHNSILANSTTSAFECYIESGTISGGNNIIEDGSCLTNSLTTEALSADPNLASSLNDNGGSTFTIALNAGSIAIDAGDGSCEDSDQRGIARSGTCDIGAYEFIPTSNGLVVDSLADGIDSNTTFGNNTLREAIDFASIGDTITFSTSIDGDTITLSEPLVINKSLTIDGSGLAISISGANSTRHFNISTYGVSLKNLTLTNGDAGSGVGGSIYIGTGSATLENMEIKDSKTTDAGGAIYAGGEAGLTINRSLIRNNQAERGGAIYVHTTSLTLMNSTLTGNQSNANKGGAIYLDQFTGATLTNNTIAGNSSGVMANATDSVKLLNTILANTADDCLLDDADTASPAITLSENNQNLIQDGSCDPAYSGDAKLASLADNGGNTLTMKLLTGSDAINNGSDSVCDSLSGGNTDQRGEARVEQCDIGAYEAQPNVVPTAPSDLTLIPTSSSQINLAWVDNSDDETGFKIFRDGTEIVTLPANEASFIDSNLTCGTEYNYEVYATNEAGDSTALIGSQITAACTASTAPSNLTASPLSGSQILLTWTDNSIDETSFTLSRDGTVIAVLEPDMTTYTDENLDCGSGYTYTLYATSAIGDSDIATTTASSGECIDNAFNPPNAPANLTATSLSETTIYLTWLDDSSIEELYTILRDGLIIAELDPNTSSFTDSGLLCGSGYTYSIFATNQYGESAYVTSIGETLVCGSDPLPPTDGTQSLDGSTDGSTGGTDGGGGTTTDSTLNPPSNLAATLRPNNTVDLEWLDNSDREIGFIVSRNNQVWAELPENEQFFTDFFIDCGFVYDYNVVATDGMVNSLAATVTVVAPVCETDSPNIDIDTPNAIDNTIPSPYNLSATAISESEVTLSWQNDDAGQSGYYIERNGIGLTTTSSTQNILDRNLQCEQTYTYSVQTLFGSIASEPSTITVLMPSCTAVTADDTVEVDAEGNPIFKLSISTTGEGSVFECGQQCTQEYPPSTEVFLIPDPELDWEFIGWSGDCDAEGFVVMLSNQQCTANFAPLAYTEEPVTVEAEVILELNVEGEGYIEDCGTACTYVYPHGSDVLINAISAQGWTLKDWRGRCGFGHVYLDQDTLCTAIFEPLPDVTEAPQNPDTIPVEDGQLTDGTIPQDGSVSNVQIVGTNQNDGLVSNVTIEEGAELQGGRLSGSNVNYGTVEDVNIRPYSELEGGTVAGEIQNDGEMRDVTIEDGATVTGEGSLGGTINNGGTIDDIVLEPDTVIIGGELRGVIVGDPEQPARIGDAKIENAVLSNMCITPTVELDDSVTLGENVTLPSEGDNLTILDFCVYPTEVEQIDQNDLTERVEPAAFSTFTPEMMKELPPDDLEELTEEDLAFLDINAAKQMTDEQFDSIPLESLKGLPPETLDVLPAEIVKDMSVEQVSNLNKDKFKEESGDKDKQSRAATKLLTNISKQVLEESGIDPAELLPDDWEIDPETQEIKPPAGSRVVYKSFELKDVSENLDMPEVPDFYSGFGIDGEGTPLIENLNNGLDQTQATEETSPVFQPEDISKFEFKQKDNSILNVVGTDEFADLIFSFLPDTSTIQQADEESVEVGLNQVDGGFLQITMPNSQQFVMIPSPDKPDELHAIFGNDAIIRVNEKGEVFVNYTDEDGIQRFLIIMFDAFVADDDGERLTFIADVSTTRSRNSRAIREGRVVFSDGSAQAVYPAVLYPGILIGLLSQIGAANVIYNVDGTFSLLFNGQTLTLLPTYNTQVQSLEVWERIGASIYMEGNELVYSVQDTTASQLVVSRLVISF